MNTRIIKKCKQLLLVVACVVLMFVVNTNSVLAQTKGECGSDVTWVLSNGTLTISGQGEMYDYSEYNLAPWYEVRNEISSIVIKEGITNVGNTAFYDCYNLKNVVLSDTVKTIGKYAFLQCERLETIDLSDSLVSINDCAFKLCRSLKAITLPNTLQSIGYESFFMCKSLISITIPNSVLTMGDCAFTYCDGLLQAIVNASIVELPLWTFYGCDNLVNVSFSSSIREIGTDAFYDCNNLTNVSSGAYEDVREGLTNQIKENVTNFGGVTQNNNINNSYTWELDNTTQKDVVENESVVLGGNITNNNNQIDTSIDVVIKDESGWDTTIEKVDEYLQKNEIYNDNPIDVNVTVQNEQKISGELLNTIAGENANINVTLGDVEFIISGKTLNKSKNYKDFTFEYTLEKIIDRDDSIIDVIGDAEAYYLKLKKNVDFGVTVKIYLDRMGYASLYQKSNVWDLVQSTGINSNGYASFYLDSFDNFTQYLIGINVKGVESNTIIVPEENYDNYNGLMDEYGNKYEITGVESKWGITIGQFTLYLVAALVAIVSIIGVIMYVLYKYNQTKMNNVRYKKERKHKK